MFPFWRHPQNVMTRVIYPWLQSHMTPTGRWRSAEVMCIFHDDDFALFDGWISYLLACSSPPLCCANADIFRLIAFKSTEHVKFKFLQRDSGKHSKGFELWQLTQKNNRRKHRTFMTMDEMNELTRTSITILFFAVIPVLIALIHSLSSTFIWHQIISFSPQRTLWPKLLGIVMMYLMFVKQQHILESLRADRQSYLWCVFVRVRACVRALIKQIMHFTCAVLTICMCLQPHQLRGIWMQPRLSKVKHVHASVWYIMRAVPDGIFESLLELGFTVGGGGGGVVSRVVFAFRELCPVWLSMMEQHKWLGKLTNLWCHLFLLPFFCGMRRKQAIDLSSSCIV